jgi:hypothetical protein
LLSAVESQKNHTSRSCNDLENEVKQKRENMHNVITLGRLTTYSRNDGMVINKWLVNCICTSGDFDEETVVKVSFT